MLDQLGIPSEERSFKSIETGLIQSGLAIGTPSPIFPKLDTKDLVKVEPNQDKKAAKAEKKAVTNQIDEELIKKYMSLSLEELEKEIVIVGNEVKQLKAQQAEKEAIQTKVKDLLVLKER